MANKMRRKLAPKVLGPLPSDFQKKMELFVFNV